MPVSILLHGEKTNMDAKKQVIQRYDPYLVDFAQSHYHLRTDAVMGGIERVIIEAVKRGIESQYGKDIVLGIAIARDYGSPSFESCNRPIRDDILQEAVKWLMSQFTKGLSVKRPRRSKQEYESIIRHVNTDWENMPVTHPLLTA